MKWYSVKDKLPPINTNVLVCRIIKIPSIDVEIKTHDIGRLDGINPGNRWNLESQQYSILPTTPTLDSGIVTHWMKLPKLPN